MDEVNLAGGPLGTDHPEGPPREAWGVQIRADPALLPLGAVYIPTRPAEEETEMGGARSNGNDTWEALPALEIRVTTLGDASSLEFSFLGWRVSSALALAVAAATAFVVRSVAGWPLLLAPPVAVLLPAYLQGTGSAGEGRAGTAAGAAAKTEAWGLTIFMTKVIVANFLGGSSLVWVTVVAALSTVLQVQPLAAKPPPGSVAAASPPPPPPPPPHTPLAGAAPSRGVPASLQLEPLTPFTPILATAGGRLPRA